MEGPLLNNIKKFFRTFPHLGPTLSRFPEVSGTFWKAGIFKVVLRLANHYANYAQLLMKKEHACGYPSHLIIDITNVCTLKCRLCPTGAGLPGRKKGMMPLPVFRKIIDETGRYLISVDLFNWGEPLMNKDVYQMIAYAHARHIVTSVSSNFQHFSEAAADQMIASGLDVLILSIDGASQESYEKYRIGGDFRKVIEHLSLLVKKKNEQGSRKPYICWQFLVMRHNEHEVEAAKKMADELGVDRIAIDHAYLPVMFREEAVKWLPQNPEYHRYDRAELERTWRELEKAQETAPASDIQEAVADPQELREEDIYAQDTFHRRANCSWLWTQATINWDGTVAPCCAVYDPSLDFGNITETSFRNIWNNEKYRASRRFSSKGEAGGVRTICMQCPLVKHG